MTTSNNERHEFAPITDPAFKGTTFEFRCCRCGLPREAKVHAARVSEPLSAERRKQAEADAPVWHEPSRQPAAAPERVWLSSRCLPGTVIVSSDDPSPDDVCYIREDVPIALITKQRDEWQRLKSKEVERSPSEPTTEYWMFRDYIVAANELLQLIAKEGE